jgi:hypothetical protein
MKTIKISLQNTAIFWLCFAFFTICSKGVIGQNVEKPIAPFKILLVNGQTFSHTQLQKKRPTALVYFDPECDHCVMFTKELINQKRQLTNQQIVMITFRPPADVKNFGEKMKISSVKNIQMGTEQETFVVRKYYKIYTFPFVATYSASGKLSKIYDKGMNDLAGIRNVVNEIKKLR